SVLAAARCSTVYPPTPLPTIADRLSPSTTTPAPTRSPAFFLHRHRPPPDLHPFPTRRSSDRSTSAGQFQSLRDPSPETVASVCRSEEHTSELQSRGHLVCRLLLERKKKR